MFSAKAKEGRYGRMSLAGDGMSQVGIWESVSHGAGDERR